MLKEAESLDKNVELGVKYDYFLCFAQFVFPKKLDHCSLNMNFPSIWHPFY